MSATAEQRRARAASLVAVAIARALSTPAWAGRRAYCTGLLGLDPVDIYGELAALITASVQVDPGAGASLVSIGAIAAGPNLLIPYLVTPPGTGTTENSGSSGFAATLRTQFRHGITGDRILLILADRPDETVTTASDDIASLRGLRLPALLDAVAAEHVGGRIAGGTLLADILADMKASNSTAPPWQRLALSDEFLRQHSNDSPVQLGTNLYLLGEYLSDPAATGKRLREGRIWRSLISAAAATPSRSLDHHLVAKKANPRGARLVADSVGPSGISWSAFTLGDLIDREGSPGRLDLDSREPVTGTRLTLRGSGGALILCLPSAGGSARLNLTRGLVPHENVSITLVPDVPALGAIDGQSASFHLAPTSGHPWRFGWARLGSSEPLPLAVTFDDRDAIALEDGLSVDPANGAFLCGEEPQLRCWTDSGRDLGLARLDPGEDDPDETQQITGTAPGGQPVGPVPVLALGSSDQGTDDPDPGDQGHTGSASHGDSSQEPDKSRNSDGEDGEDFTGADAVGDAGEAEADESQMLAHEYRTLPHALHALGVLEWPSGAGVNEQGELRAIVAAKKATIRPRLGATDLLQVERQTHAHPEWAHFQVLASDPTGSVVQPGRAQKLVDLPDPQPGWAAEMTTFRAARTAYFAAASDAGSAYAVDPQSPVAAGYVAAYRDLLWALPRTGVLRSEYDLLITLDLIEIAGVRDLLISPMSPLSVAFHAELASRLRTATDGTELLAPGDIGSLRLQWTVPLLNLQGSWFESVPTEQASLWRQYATLDDASQGSHSRNAAFIKNRIEFFLAVHPHLATPANTIAISCATPGNGQPLLNALRLLHKAELKDTHTGYTHPSFDITLAAPSPDVRETLGELMAGGPDHEVDRVIRTRCTIRRQDEAAPRHFSHLAFLFRTPGGRSTAPVDMGRRAPTTYAQGLATSPGRARIDDAGLVFATGVFASQPATGASNLERIQYRTLELVGGQGGERLEPGGTRMVRASASGSTLDAWYEHSAWVVHLDRMIGIEAFADDSGRSILEYEDRAEPAAFGYDGITATRYVAPYLAALRRSVADLAALTEDRGRQLMSLLESVSGRWTLQIIQREIPKVRERVGTACAIDYIGRAEQTLPGESAALAALVALEEVVPGFPEPGIPAIYQRSRRGQGPICDDLLLVTLTPRPAHPPLLSATVIEVKFTSGAAPDIAKAADQVASTNQWLDQRFGDRAPSRDLRGAELAELLRSAASRNRAFAFGTSTDSGPAEIGDDAENALAQLGTGNYELALGCVRGARTRRGVVVSIEASSPAAPSLTQLNGPDGPLDLVTLGKAWMRDVLSGAQPSRPTNWPALGPAEPPDASPGDNPPAGDEPPTGGSQPGHGDSSGQPAPGGTPGPCTVAVTPPDPSITAIAAKLDQAFARYGLPIEGFDPALAQRGPSLTRFRSRGLGKLAITDVERRARDLAREIEAPGQLLVGDEPGYITVDVPRADREVVQISQLLPALQVPSRPGALDFIAGVTPSGETRTADLSRLPHLLVAGATGSGKSVFLRGLLVELLRARTAEQLQLLIVDPKRLDFAPFARAPHHRGAILHDTDEALQTLQFTLDAEIDLRQPLLQRAGASSAAEFYEAGGTLEELPQLVIVIDEFADLILSGSNRKAFSEMIQRYAQLTRAYGIYLVLATQRPSVDVITGSIKANLTARIAFALPSYRDSMTILDRAGAEDLLGDGDMLFYRNGKVERLQAALTSLADINEVLG
jgi:FtsK/SpoIIIE family